MNDLALRIALTAGLLLLAWAASELPVVRKRIPAKVAEKADWLLYGGVGLLFVGALLWLWVGIDL